MIVLCRLSANCETLKIYGSCRNRSIPASLVTLCFLCETINTMRLGGPALAVGILVDDLTVRIRIACSPKSEYRCRPRPCTALPA